MRVDLELRGALPYGTTTPMPDSQILGSWTNSAEEKLDKLLTEFSERAGQIVSVTGGHELISVEARSSPGGTLFLGGVAVSGFRLVRMPRVWDDPGRQRTEKGNDEELAQLCRRFRDAIDEWSKSVTDLARWIRYSPPPAGSKPAEPWLEDESEDPETVH